MFDPRSADRAFGALAHASRRAILDLLVAEPGATVGEVAARFDVSRIAVMKHLRVLEDAGLVVSLREGRTRRLHFNGTPLQFLYDRWMTRWSALWARGLAGLKYRLEERREPWRGSPSSPASRSAPPSRRSGRRSSGRGPSAGSSSTRSSTGR